MGIQPIDFTPYRRIVVLTGSGVSAGSGLQTFRGEGGLWQHSDFERYAHAEAWRRDPLGAWRAFGKMREAIAAAEPNPAHRALADFAARTRGDREFFLITQNVDGLHQRAGSEKVIELHGNLLQSRCSNDRCVRSPFPDRQSDFRRIPVCETCGELIRPDITLFGEMIGWNAERRSREAMQGCDMFIAIGTSGMVMPASLFVDGAKEQDARTILVNLDPMDPPNEAFDEEVLGRAEEVLPVLLGV